MTHWGNPTYGGFPLRGLPPAGASRGRGCQPNSRWRVYLC